MLSLIIILPENVLELYGTMIFYYKSQNGTDFKLKKFLGVMKWYCTGDGTQIYEWELVKLYTAHRVDFKMVVVMSGPWGQKLL